MSGLAGIWSLLEKSVQLPAIYLRQHGRMTVCRTGRRVLLAEVNSLGKIESRSVETAPGFGEHEGGEVAVLPM